MKPDQIAKRLQRLTGRFSLYDVFRDWVESMAYAIANAVDHRHEVRAARETAYMAIVHKHGEDGPRVMAEFKDLFHNGLVPALEGDGDDVLGEVYMRMELGNDRAGQFFTPMSVCDLMAELTIGDTLPPCGFATIQEPAIGGGAMVIAYARAMRRRGFDPSRHIHVTGIDVDRKVLLMAYVQLSLLGIPAVLYVGDTLRLEMREAWPTPVHVLGGWEARLGLRALEALGEVAPGPAASDGEPDVAAPAEAPPTPAPGQISLF